MPDCFRDCNDGNSVLNSPATLSQTRRTDTAVLQARNRLSSAHEIRLFLTVDHGRRPEATPALWRRALSGAKGQRSGVSGWLFARLMVGKARRVAPSGLLSRLRERRETPQAARVRVSCELRHAVTPSPATLAREPPLPRSTSSGWAGEGKHQAAEGP